MGSEREGKEKVDELISVEQFIRADGKVVNVAKTFLITLNLPLSRFFACLNAYPAGSSTLLFSLFFLLLAGEQKRQQICCARRDDESFHRRKSLLRARRPRGICRTFNGAQEEGKERLKR